MIGLLLIVFVIARARTFDGENTCFYFIWYGIGRAWIEGLRTDSLYLFDWTLFDKPIRVSQVLSLLLVLAAFVVLIIGKRRHPHGREALFVTKRAALAAQAAAAAAGETGGPALENAAAEDAAEAESAPAEETGTPAETESESVPEERAAAPEDKN